MKRIIITIVAATFACTTFAQVPEQLKKGRILINANSTEANIRFTHGVSLNINGTGGYFVMDKLAIGGNLGLDVVSTEVWDGWGGSRNQSNTTFNLGVGARYHFLEGKKGSLFTTGLFNIAVGSGDPVFGMALQGGYAFFLNRYVSVEPVMGLILPFKKGAGVDFVIGAGISLYL